MSPVPLSVPLGLFQFCMKIRREYSRMNIYDRCQHTRNKLFTGVTRVNCSLLIVPYCCLFQINVINTTASCSTSHCDSKSLFCMQSHKPCVMDAMEVGSCQGFEKVEGDKMVISLMCSYGCCIGPKSSVLVDIPI